MVAHPSDGQVADAGIVVHASPVKTPKKRGSGAAKAAKAPGSSVKQKASNQKLERAVPAQRGSGSGQRIVCYCHVSHVPHLCAPGRTGRPCI